ncbi:hypothetical protein ABT143_12925 [Streptomyces sp. NPDC002033]|uniref:hypothetical protein n=1 Tax=unclassified Streptomyces TaxID=2593676 RepID=UPI0033247520
MGRYNRPRDDHDAGGRCGRRPCPVPARPQATNPHLLITSQTYRHPASPPISYLAIRTAFDQIGLLPRQVWADRILDEARETADPVHLVRLFGIHPSIAVKYVHAAHPDKALPRIH